MTRVLALCLIALLAGPTQAWAQSAKAQARKAFNEGRDHFAAERYPEALAAFTKANELKPHPLMLFNIAQVHEAMDDLPNAIATFNAYLAKGAKNADEVKARVRELQRTVAGWGTLGLTTTPPGAEVSVGAAKNPSRCTTPCDLKLPPGRQTLFIALDGYRAVQRPLSIKAKAKDKLAIAMPPILPLVAVSSVPPGAKLRFDDEKEAHAATPHEQGLTAGKHSVLLELKDFEATRREFTLDKSHIKTPLKLSVQLEKAIPKGMLQLTVDGPDGLWVLIDGQPHGQTPLPPEPIALPAGLHTLEIKGEGVDPYEEKVAIDAGKTTQTNIEIDGGGGLSGGISMKTLSWILVGVGGATVAAGAITGGLALGTQGDLEDCQDDAACKRTQKEADLAGDVQSQALLTDVLIGAGVAVAASGVALMFFATDPEQQTPTTGVFVAPSPGGVAAIGRFEF